MSRSKGAGGRKAAKGRKWVMGLIAVLALAAIAVAVVIVTRRAVPDSIAAALLARKDELPGRYVVVLPQSAVSALGRRAESGSPVDGDGDRRVTVEAVPCFFMAPTERPGLGEMIVRYRAGGTLTAELGQAARSAGVTLSEQDSAELSLRELRLVQAVGVPNPSAPCFNGQAKESLTVASSELVAGKVEATFARRLDVGADGGAAGAGATGKATAGFTLSESGSLLGTDIVLGASFSRVDVEVTRQSVDLGTTPAAGQRFEFPLGLDGSVTVLAYDHPEGHLDVQVATALHASSQPPDGLRTCEVGKMVAVKAGDRCDFWLAPGNGLVAVEWSLASVDGAPHVTLHLKAYRTSFAASAPGG